MNPEARASSGVMSAKVMGMIASTSISPSSIA
jgi:hypothetical protein